LEVPAISIGVIVLHLQSAVMMVIVYGYARRIENTQSASRAKHEVFSISPYE
jgi:hypothetical protein